jgi:threonine/homoserine/homoserine lactone efflux protein
MPVQPFVAGALAGYGVAIPVGAVAILIVDLGMRRGFRVGAAAGAGAATADLLYATLAMVGGAAVGAILAPWSVTLRATAGIVLLAVGAQGLRAVARMRRGAAPPPPAPSTQARTAGGSREVAGTYARFVAITILNPTTVVYFAALILGLPAVAGDPGSRLAFVAGAGLASLSWQTLLAGVGAIAHHRLPGRFRVGVSLLGNLIICGFGLGILRSIVT